MDVAAPEDGRPPGNSSIGVARIHLPHLQSGLPHGTASRMSDALMTATMGEPFFSLSDLAEVLVMTETISPPPGKATTTSALTTPLVILLILPAILFRALMFIIFYWMSSKFSSAQSRSL